MGQRTLSIAFSQVALFNSELSEPFNDWSPEHVLQGFAWRPGSVSFKTLDEDGDLDVEFEIIDNIELADGVERAISVPFRSFSAGQVECATITGSFKERLPAGEYQVVFQAGRLNGRQWARFSAIAGGDQQPRILVNDRDSPPLFPLLMSTRSA